MLEPQARKLLFDVLRPPADYTLDFAIGTTYTLDLLTLLVAPVAFTLFEADDPEKLLNRDSFALLESLRRYSDRMVVFCHGGHIKVPSGQFPQFEYLERMVVQCEPHVVGATFHPKVWLLRFTKPDEVVTYRFACLTRNLTFDRCWDTVVTLEGPLLKRQNAIAANRPLGDFVAALPSFTKNVSSAVAARIDQMQSEVRRVDFQPPDDIERIGFHPLGIVPERHRVPFEGIGDRMLVISPFVTEDGLRRLVRGRQGCILVSRPEALQQVSEVPAEITKVFALNEQVDTPSALEEEIPLSRGLHAKCYIIENGWKASIWSGSANATQQGFNGNVEFLVELVGPKSKVGIDALLQVEPGKTGFADLLVPFSKPANVSLDPQVAELTGAINDARLLLSNAGLQAVITETNEVDLFNVTLGPTKIIEKVIPDSVAVSCWPVTLGQGWKRAVTTKCTPIMFEGVSLEALTSFFAFEIVMLDGAERQESESFVLNVVLEGAPQDRRERLLRTMIGNSQRFLQLVKCLLADEGFDLSQTIQAFERGEAARTGSGPAEEEAALFESLVRNLERNPERLDHIASLINDLRHQPKADVLFPTGFDRIWEPIWAARQKGQQCQQK